MTGVLWCARVTIDGAGISTGDFDTAATLDPSPTLAAVGRGGLCGGLTRPGHRTGLGVGHRRAAASPSTIPLAAPLDTRDCGAPDLATAAGDGDPLTGDRAAISDHRYPRAPVTGAQVDRIALPGHRLGRRCGHRMMTAVPAEVGEAELELARRGEDGIITHAAGETVSDVVMLFHFGVPLGLRRCGVRLDLVAMISGRQAMSTLFAHFFDLLQVLDISTESGIGRALSEKAKVRE